MVKSKAFDYIKMKQVAQEKIRAAVAGLSPEKEIAFFRAGAEEFERSIQAVKEARAGDRRKGRTRAT